MGSGVIYAGLVVMWAAYFIPRWLRRHEELSATRSVERFDRAMSILSRKEATPDKRYVVMPPRAAEPDRSGGSFPAQRTKPQRRGLRTTSPITVRRRRVLAALLMTTLVAGISTPLTPLAWWSAPAVALVIVGYLVHCRLQARTRTQVAQTRVAARKRSTSRLLRFDAIERLMAVRREMAEERAAEDARWEAAEEAMSVEREAEEARERAAAEGWSPVPVPLPTYVTKPVAPRRAAPIDLTNPGAWTAAQTTQASAAGPGDGRPVAMSALLDDAAEADDQLEAIITRRAVND